MIFKIYDCDFSVTIRGQVYTFPEVDNMSLEDPETTELTRGANASNKVGIAYKSGLKEAKTLTVTLLGLTKPMHDLLKDVYNKKERVEASFIDRTDGSSKSARSAILSQSPKQLNLDEGPESMNTALIFKSFDVDEIHKS